MRVVFDKFRNPQFQQIFSSFKICVAIFTLPNAYDIYINH